MQISALRSRFPRQEIAEGSVVVERRLPAELRSALPPQLLVTIPRSTEVVGRGSDLVVPPGCEPRTTVRMCKERGGREMAGSGSRFQPLLAGEQRPIDMDGGGDNGSQSGDDPASGVPGSAPARARYITTHGRLWVLLVRQTCAIGDQISGVMI
jgi:hypothetical protein